MWLSRTNSSSSLFLTALNFVPVKLHQCNPIQTPNPAVPELLWNLPSPRRPQICFHSSGRSFEKKEENSIQPESNMRKNHLTISQGSISSCKLPCQCCIKRVSSWGSQHIPTLTSAQNMLVSSRILAFQWPRLLWDFKGDVWSNYTTYFS